MKFGTIPEKIREEISELDQIMIEGDNFKLVDDPAGGIIAYEVDKNVYLTINNYD